MLSFFKERKIAKYRKIVELNVEENNQQKEKFLSALKTASAEELQAIKYEPICRCLSNTAIEKMRQLGLEEEIKKSKQSESETLALFRQIEDKLEQMKKDEEIEKIALALKKLGY